MGSKLLSDLLKELFVSSEKDNTVVKVYKLSSLFRRKDNYRLVFGSRVQTASHRNYNTSRVNH